jgi:hypothetical protein
MTLEARCVRLGRFPARPPVAWRALLGDTRMIRAGFARLRERRTGHTAGLPEHFARSSIQGRP